MRRHCHVHFVRPAKCLTWVQKIPYPCPLRWNKSHAALAVTDNISRVSSPQSAPYLSGASHVQRTDSLAAVPVIQMLCVLNACWRMSRP